MTTWNPSDKNASITLSNSNRTALSSGAGNHSVRATASFSSGKHYFEATPDVLAGTEANVWGVANATQSLSSFLGGTGSNSVGWNNDGKVFLNNSSTAGFPTFTAGASLGIAFDVDAGRIWFTADGSTWNLGGTADPATGIGGFDISGITGALFPAWTGGADTAKGTADFGVTAFAYSVPSGFSRVDALAGAHPVAKITRLSLDGYGVKRAGSFAGKTAAAVSPHPVGKITRLALDGYGARRYRLNAFAGKTSATPVTGPPKFEGFRRNVGRLMR